MTYTYFIAGQMSSDVLKTLIQANSSLAATFLYINTSGTTENDVEGTSVEIVFADSLSTTDHDALTAIVDSYAVVAPLQMAKADKLNQIQNDIQNFIEARYSFLLRFQLMNLYTLAKFDNLTNRAAYIRPGINYMNGIVNYGVTISAAINSLTTIEAVEAYTYNIAANTGSNPNITLPGALTI
jgi:hypothetical protein